jgi:glycosyltransferase involved in cell wall biosynthesis
VRVLQVDSGREYRGGQDQVRLLARALTRVPDLEQRLVTRRGSELARRATADGVTVREVPWGPGLDPRAWWRLVVESLAWRPDLIHAHNAHAVTVALWAHRCVGILGSPPRIVATRRVVFPVRAWSALRHADKVVAVSQAVRSTLLAAGLAPGDITVVPDGIEPEDVLREAGAPLAIRAALGLPPGTPLAVNVAVLEPSKDHVTLVRAAHAARDLHPTLHWVIAGEGPARPVIEREIERLHIGDRVYLLGHVDRADALIREGDALVMSSREEGLGSVVLHALALGKPVVATAGGGLPEMVPPDWVVPVGDAAALARTVVRALEHPSPFSLPRQFTASAMAAGVLAVYRSLV